MLTKGYNLISFTQLLNALHRLHGLRVIHVVIVVVYKIDNKIELFSFTL